MALLLGMKSLMQLADNRDPNSYANAMRRRRIALFKQYLDLVARPITILDVGGTPTFWKNMQLDLSDDVRIVVLNLSPSASWHPCLETVVGDARNIHMFGDRHFDVAFSNSVIEHVGHYGDQCKMASEMRRVAKRLFLQTPNRYFPIEPHFLFPFFQFLPVPMRSFLVSHWKLGWYPRFADRAAARAAVRAIRLVSRRELTRLFPGARIHCERVLGLTKSFIVVDGWEEDL